MSGSSTVSSTFTDAVTRPASTFANVVTPPASTLAACGTPPVSWVDTCEGLPPVISSLTPASGRQGDAVSVSIAGTGFFPDAVIAVSGSGITISGVQVVSTTLIVATFTIGAGASATARTVIVTTFRGTSAGATFTVTVASRSSIWLDPSVSSSLTVVSGAVSQANDVTGNGNNVAQGTASARPLLQAAAMNNLPAFRFDGVDDYLGMNWPNAEQLSGGSTLFIVCKPRFTPGASKNYPLIRWMNSNATGMQAESTIDPVTASRGRLEGFTAPAAGGLKRATPAATVDTNVTRVHVLIVDPSGGGSIKLYRNGTLVGSATTFGALTSSVGDILRIGRDEVVSGNFGDYDVGEVRVFPSVLSDAERQAFESYLMNKWLDGTGTATRGPILLATQVIDGVTVDVLTWAASPGDPDFQSFDTAEGYTAIRFSEPIKRFKGTWVHGQSNPVNQLRLVMGVTNYVAAFNWTPVCLSSVPANVDGWVTYLEDPTGSGFTHIIARVVGSGTSWNAPSVLKDCYFSKLGDP